MIQTILFILVIGLLVSRFLPVRGVNQMDAADMKKAEKQRSTAH